jgi:hypothetical protein
MQKLFQGSGAIFELCKDDAQLSESVVLAAYRQLFGELAEKLPPCSYAAGILSLTAQSAAWKKEGIANHLRIARDINNALGSRAVVSIHWQSWEERKIVAEQEQTEAEPLPEDLRLLTEGIEDPKMKAAMQKLLQSFNRHGKLEIGAK